MNYLLDTCVVSDFLKKTPEVVRHFQAISPKNIYISSISAMEIEYGLYLAPERAIKIRPKWVDLSQHVHVLDYSQKCSSISASLRATLKKSGTPIGHYDILIAGSALAHQMVLVTSNMNEFRRIPNLTIENWR